MRSLERRDGHKRIETFEELLNSGWQKVNVPLPVGDDGVHPLPRREFSHGVDRAKLVRRDAVRDVHSECHAVLLEDYCDRCPADTASVRQISPMLR
jgi:hypothetical protein